MYLTGLSLTNFRNYRSLELALPKGPVVIHGANAQGKSNFLEAAYFVSIARSYNVHQERELIHHNALIDGEPAVITAEAEAAAGHIQARVVLRAKERGVEKQIRINGLPCLASELVGQVNAVLFTASDLDLVYGAPSSRRRFLDILISQVDRGYLKTLQRYQRVLSQRNHLLRMVKDASSKEEELAFWDVELIKEGTAIIDKRQSAISDLSKLAREAYQELVPDYNLNIDFIPSVGLSESYEERLREVRGREMALGVTLVGPHRDDLGIVVDDVDMGTYASRGEARTIALALRLAEASFLRDMRGEEPILLLDDILSELDSCRRKLVVEKLCLQEQALLTTTDLSLLDSGALQRMTRFQIRGGIISA